MKDKVLCPWCGAEMHLVLDEVPGLNFAYTGLHNGNFACGCGAQSPRVCDMSSEDVRESAYAAAMQRYIEPANGCCWCIADGVINKVYIRTDDSDYTFVDAKFCPKCGRDLEESQ